MENKKSTKKINNSSIKSNKKKLNKKITKNNSTTEQINKNNSTTEQISKNNSEKEQITNNDVPTTEKITNMLFSNKFFSNDIFKDIPVLLKSMDNIKNEEDLKNIVNDNPCGMNDIMSNVIMNIDKMMKPDEKTNNSKLPNDTPEIPLNRSKKSIENEKKNHLIYKGFNESLIGLIDMLIIKLPHKTNHYESIKKMIILSVDINPCKGVETWKESVAGKEDKLQTYSDENILFICKNINSMSFLKILELENEWNKFTPQDFKNLWNSLNQLQNMSEMIDFIPVEMMTSIQNMTLNNENFKISPKFDNSGNILNLKELFNSLSKSIFENDEIVKGMKNMSNNLIKSMQENSIPEPTGYKNILNKANK